MKEPVTIKRTNSNNVDFQQLIKQLDHELWNELNENQATYDQYNKVQGLNTVVVVYENERPVAIGCFKKYSNDTVEIKRMFVEKEYRGRGFSKVVLKELEKWAEESGFRYAILETSIHFNTARGLYSNACYVVIENYDQYKGLEESVCMRKELMKATEATVFKDIGIEYFSFEEDFVEKNIRCIPMIVRFKMDRAGIKLKLAEWSKFSTAERIELAKRTCTDDEEIKLYHDYLTGLIKSYTDKEATGLAIDQNPGWTERDNVPGLLEQKAKEFDWSVSAEQWRGLTDLQRFALLKLCRRGHESKNFPKAMKEFGLLSAKQISV